jgi:hypothetical protein
MASGHMNRVKRPDTWLHRPMLQNVKKVLANPEPSTHDPPRSSGQRTAMFLNWSKLTIRSHGTAGNWPVSALSSRF